MTARIRRDAWVCRVLSSPKGRYRARLLFVAHADSVGMSTPSDAAADSSRRTVRSLARRRPGSSDEGSSRRLATGQLRVRNAHVSEGLTTVAIPLVANHREFPDAESVAEANLR
jgi:hypothetical protein